MALALLLVGADAEDGVLQLLLKCVAPADTARLSACCKALRNRLRFRVGYAKVDRCAAALAVAVPPWQHPSHALAWRWATVWRKDTVLHPQWCATFTRPSAEPPGPPRGTACLKDAPPEPWSKAPPFEGVVCAGGAHGVVRGTFEEEVAFRKPLNDGRYGTDQWHRRATLAEFALPMCVTSDLKTVERKRNTVPTLDPNTGELARHPDHPDVYHPTIAYDVIKEDRTLSYAIDPKWSFEDSYGFLPGAALAPNLLADPMPSGTPMAGLRRLLPPAVWEHARADPRSVRVLFLGSSYGRRQVFSTRADVSGADPERPSVRLVASSSRVTTRVGTIAPAQGKFVIVIGRRVGRCAERPGNLHSTMLSLAGEGTSEENGSWVEPTAGLHGALCDTCAFDDCVVIRGQFRLVLYPEDLCQYTGADAVRVSRADLPPMFAHPCYQRTHPVVCRIQDLVLRTAIPRALDGAWVPSAAAPSAPAVSAATVAASARAQQQRAAARARTGGRTRPRALLPPPAKRARPA